VFSIDVFEGELEGLVLCETEAESLEDLMSAEQPTFVSHEVTEDSFFQGGSLCRTPRADLVCKLAMFE
jgi:CYTH domain-containing protein